MKKLFILVVIILATSCVSQKKLLESYSPKNTTIYVNTIDKNDFIIVGYDFVRRVETGNYNIKKEYNYVLYKK